MWAAATGSAEPSMGLRTARWRRALGGRARPPHSLMWHRRACGPPWVAPPWVGTAQRSARRGGQARREGAPPRPAPIGAGGGCRPRAAPSSMAARAEPPMKDPYASHVTPRGSRAQTVQGRAFVMAAFVAPAFRAPLSACLRRGSERGVAPTSRPKLLLRYNGAQFCGPDHIRPTCPGPRTWTPPHTKSSAGGKPFQQHSRVLRTASACHGRQGHGRGRHDTDLHEQHSRMGHTPGLQTWCR